jgi:transposase
LASPARFSRSIQVAHRRCRPAANETVLGLRRAVGTEVVHRLGANKPAYKLDPGFLEHPRLSPRVVIGPGARFLEFLFTEPHAADATQEEEMELLHRRCCGLDVHKETVVACLRLVSDGKVTTEVRTFQTTTADLLRLSEWLTANDCTHVAMEATGVYWKPVWHILDDGEFELVLANAAHVKNVPGRKTDVNDAMWLAELLAHGLIRASFVPDTQTQEMRNLMRTRKQLVREQSSHVLRVQKTLEDANIKLDSVLTDLMGKSGRAMIEALIAGETNPVKLASLASRRVKASPEELREALRGRVTKHHRFLLRLHLDQIDALAAAMGRIDAQVEANLGPFRTAVDLIMSIPGVKNLGAQAIVSEIGIDMSRFPSEAHLISWACICPRNDESAGKRRSNRLRKGATWLKTTLVQCAWAAVKKKDSYLQAQFYRIKARRGPKKAIMAVAASILTAIYHMLKDGTMYHDLGRDHFDRRSTDQQKKSLVKRLADLGYAVEIKPLAATA